MKMIGTFVYERNLSAMWYFVWVLFFCSEALCNPHGHLHLLKTLKYGASGGASPTAIDGQAIASGQAGAGSYAGSYAQSNAASYANTGSFNIGASMPFGLGFNMGFSGGQSESQAQASSHSGAIAGNNGQTSAFIAPYNNNYNSGASAGGHASSGAFAAGIGSIPVQQNNGPSYENYNNGIHSNVGQYPTKGQGVGSSNSGSFAISGATSNTETNINNNGQIGTGFDDTTNNKKVEGSLVITSITPIREYSPTLDADYDRQFQRPVQTAGAVFKPDSKFPQTSYGYVPEGQPNIYIDGSVPVINSVPNHQGSVVATHNVLHTTVKPTTPHGMKIVTPHNKKPTHSTVNSGSVNTQFGGQFTAGSHGGNNVAGVQFAQGSHPALPVDNTGKYTGSFGGAPGVLGDQKPAGYAITGAHQPIMPIGMIGISFGHADSGAQSHATSGANTGFVASNSNVKDYTKYTGSFGGAPGILGDQRPAGYQFTKGSAGGASVSESFSHSEANNAGVSYTGSVSNNGKYNTGKYTGSFGGGPGILGDQRPPGFAVQGGVNNHPVQAPVYDKNYASGQKYTGSFGGAPGILGDQRPSGYGVQGGSISNTQTLSFTSNQGNYAPNAASVPGNAYNNNFAASGATASAGAIASASLNTNEGVKQPSSHHHHKKVNNQKVSHPTGAYDSGVYGGPGVIGIGAGLSNGGIVGEIVGDIMNGIAGTANAGSHAASSSHSTSLGVTGGLGFSSGVSSSFSNAVAGSGSIAGCCG